MNSYYLTKYSKRIYSTTLLIAFLAFSGLCFYLLQDIIYMQIFFLEFGLFSIYAVFQKIKNEHIVLAEQGIEFHTPGVIFETRWEDIKHISKYWHFGFVQECLVIDNSRIRMRKWYGHIPAPIFSSMKTLIPLSSFSENWRDSELGQQIKQYAPHLFEKEKSVQSALSADETLGAT